MTQSYRFRVCLILLVLTGLLGACSRDPNVRKQKFYNSGVRFFNKGQYQDAVIQFSNAMKIDPKFEPAYYQLARCFLKLGPSHFRDAYQELTRATELDPSDLKAQTDLGNLLLAARQFKQAQERAKIVLQKDPKNVDGLVLLANSNAGLSNLTESLAEMQSAIQLEPSRTSSYLNMGVLQLSAQKVNDAEESFKKAIEVDPKSAQAVMALGNFYVSQHRFPDAEQTFQKAISLAPTNPVPRAALAQIYMIEGKADQAEQTLVDAKKAAPDNPTAYTMLARFYVQTHQYSKALTEYASLVKDHPKDLNAQKAYAQILILNRQYDEAAKIDDAILKKSAQDSGGLILRAEIDEAQNKPNDAINTLQPLIKSEPDNYSAHYYLGLAFNLTNQPDRAEAEWREAVRLNPNMVDAQRALAGVALRKHDDDLLKQTSAALIKLEPGSPQGYILQAQSDMNDKDMADGEAALNKAIQVAPQNPQGYTSLAELRFAQKKYPESQKLFQQALDKSPGYPQALQGLVNIELAQKKPDAAIDLLNSQITKAPGSGPAYVMLAEVYLVKHDLAHAEGACAQAVRLDKNNTAAILLLGQIQTSMGSPSDAINTYNQAIAANPRDIRPYFAQAELEDKQGDWQKAQGLYQKILQIQPDFAPAQNNLAYLMIEHQQNLDVALSLAQSALRSMPDNPAAADTLGSAYFQRGDYASAEGMFKQALERDPKDASMHYHLGLTYEKLGETSLARTELQQVLTLDPKFKDAEKVHAALAQLNHG